MKDAVPATRLALIERIVGAAPRAASARERALRADFIRAYFRGVGEQDLRERSPSDLAAAALAHFEFGRRRTRGPRVSLLNPEARRDGFESRHTLLRIVTDDMPFLVDSVGMVLARAGISVHLLVHPVMGTTRDRAGRLRSVGHSTDEGTRAESWQSYEIDRQDDPAAQATLVGSIESALDDVGVAVQDWRAMRAKALEVAAGVGKDSSASAEERAEARGLLEWMEDQHYIFLGYRYYRLKRGAHEDLLSPDSRTGLGILRAGHGGRSKSTRLRGELRERAREPELLILTKANSLSTVHRASSLDYVAVKSFDAKGRVDGEHRFLGLWTSSVYYRSAREIPVLRQKVERVIAQFGLAPQSHDAKAVVNVLETFPRDELFQASVADLIRIVRDVVNLYERRTVRLIARRDPYGRFYSCFVYVPRDRYSTQVRHRIEQILVAGFQGEGFESQVQISDSHHARLHVVVKVDRNQRPRADLAALQASIAEAATSWQDRLRHALGERHDEVAALQLSARYGNVFPAAYVEDVQPSHALEDIADLEALRVASDSLRLNLVADPDGTRHRLHLKFVKLGETIPISDMLPLLENFGLRVISERPYELAWPEGGSAWIQDLELETRDGQRVDVDRIEEWFKEGIEAAWRGHIENDGFNRLVLGANLRTSDVVVLRLIAKYLLQTGVPFSQAAIERALAQSPAIARQLCALFHAQFDPAVPARSRERQAEREVAAIKRSLEKVSSLDDDRIVRAYLAVIRATLRTNFFQQASPVGDSRALSIKLDPARIPDLPLPRPKFEIFVYCPRVEGVHLRMGYVARGGIRWSDRREDFRTEVLGLMKAQNVKNTVIVPVGAKGGFYPKRMPVGGNRDAMQAEAIECYRLYIGAMLDITDNIVDSKLTAPQRVVRRDPDDAYLVVAADKGTASFSDIANAISVSRGFWLGDAFASGGSAGYDHKKMGITARGGWECVKRHLRELGVDSQSQPFTMSGIGDMSGDVFGNGLLLSKHAKLVAAFNHLHVFIDPDPDAAKGFAERQRLFRLPRSGWSDYDPKLISTGGGVWSRSEKSIPLSPEARRVLGLEVTSATPTEVIRAILRMQVDVLWNGGIGTYVKARTERHNEVGDRANDAVRVDGREVRARVIGEGGNLGLTQRGRIEYALSGGRLNTDFIDNSAGVNTSDVEVNIKILLSGPLRSGQLSLPARNRLLSGMTKDVAALVLRNNYLQSQALSTLELNAASRLSEYRQLVRSLERTGHLDRALEALPADDDFLDRGKRGAGLTRPEMSVILAYSKIWLSGELIDSDIPEDPYFSEELRRYFPEALRKRYARQIEQHRLRREIIVTATTNSLVNRMGPVFAWDAMERTSASIAQVARAYTIAREAFAMRDCWMAIESLDNKIPARAQYLAFQDTVRLLRHVNYWLLTWRRRELKVDKLVAEFRPGIAALQARMTEVSSGLVLETVLGRTAELVQEGLPEALARNVASLEGMESSFDLVELAAEYRQRVETVARIYFDLGTRIGLDWLRAQITALRVDGQWHASARSSLRDSAAYTHRRLTAQVLARARAGEKDPISGWAEARGEAYVHWNRTLTDMRAAGQADFATLTVGLSAVQKLADT